MSVISVKNIYYLGPDGSNTYNAMLNVLNTGNIEIQNKIPQKSIKSALKSIESDYSSVCVLPIENSIEGIVRETIDNLLLLEDNNIKIIGEITLPIEHLLLSSSLNKSEIKEIISHPQALSQCSKYLYKEFPDVILKEVSSTSYAAEKVSIKQDKSIAAIANEGCAKIFNLNILDKNLNDEKDNKTRFYILSREKIERKNAGKTAIILSINNHSGALYEVLKIFYKYNVNLTYIDSRPSKKKLGEYLFFIEIDGFEDEEKIKNAIIELTSIVDFFRILGSFHKLN